MVDRLFAGASAFVCLDIREVSRGALIESASLRVSWNARVERFTHRVPRRASDLNTNLLTMDGVIRQARAAARESSRWTT
jgi:hypothetical protein